MSKNRYGYGLTKRDVDALRWANEAALHTTPFFITGPDFSPYKGARKGTPTKRVKRLLEKGMVWRNCGLESNLEGGLEVYCFTAEAIHMLAKNGGYKVPGTSMVWIIEESEREGS